MNDLLARLFLWAATFFATLFWLAVLLNCSFLADPISKIHTRLSNQPLCRRTWEIANGFLEHCNYYMSSCWDVCCAVVVIFAHYAWISYFAALLFSIPPPKILDYGLVLLLTVVGCFLRASYNNFNSCLLEYDLRYFLEVLSPIISVAGIILTCTGSMSSKLGIALDCLAVLSFLNMLLYYGNFYFGLELSELNAYSWSYSYHRWWGPCKRARLWKAYGPRTFLVRDDEFERPRLGDFRFVSFGAFTLNYGWFVIATLPAVTTVVALSISIWTDDKYILLSLLSLLLLYLITHTVLSAAQVILSMSLLVIPKLCAVLLSFMMLETPIFLSPIPMSHIARFDLEDPSQHYTCNIQ
jgi:hypothetical protein